MSANPALIVSLCTCYIAIYLFQCLDNVVLQWQCNLSSVWRWTSGGSAIFDLGNHNLRRGIATRSSRDLLTVQFNSASFFPSLTTWTNQGVFLASLAHLKALLCLSCARMSLWTEVVSIETAFGAILCFALGSADVAHSQVRGTAPPHPTSYSHYSVCQF